MRTKKIIRTIILYLLNHSFLINLKNCFYCLFELYLKYIAYFYNIIKPSIMGILGSKNTLKQILLVGPEGSGKTTLLYQNILRKKEWKASPTIGFNYEELSNERGDKVGIWDIGGSDCVSSFNIFYDNKL
jgi:hypothetical protein